MNERIRELQKQSSIEQWDYDNGCYRYILNPEKFAESIVRECIGIVENYPSWYGDYRDQIEDAFRGHLVAKMKYHFGIDS